MTQDEHLAEADVRLKVGWTHATTLLVQPVNQFMVQLGAMSGNNPTASTSSCALFLPVVSATDAAGQQESYPIWVGGCRWTCMAVTT
ncbi:hypothetical protein [Thermocrispum sp.]|uniref:Uncharacterized protein n=1 Tax=Thermocrispum agreste TaxID=37925 RepID=A0ABD6FHX4_9PSEU|nr:hypothetical protein [Thermocrispum sp.]